MGEFGRRRIEKELAWEYSVQHLLAAYQRVFSNSQPTKGMAAPNDGRETPRSPAQATIHSEVGKQQ